MADVHSKEIRGKNMAAIKSRNTKPEMLVRKFLHTNGFRYKLHDKSLYKIWVLCDIHFVPFSFAFMIFTRFGRNLINHSGCSFNLA